MKGDFNCSGTEDNLWHRPRVLSAPVTTIFACLLPRVLACSATKRKKKREEWRGGGEGRWRGLETQARASLSKPPRSPNDCERFTRGRGFLPSSLFEKRVGQSVGDERERERWSWRELARNGRTEWKRKRGRRERMTAGTRSLRSVLSELLLVTVARSCGGGSSITDSSYYDFTVFPFFFSPPQFLLRGLSFFSFQHDDVLHIFCLERVLVSFSLSLSLSSLIPLLLPVPRYWC